MHRRHLIACAFATLLARSALAGGVEKERADIPEAAPVTANNIRYEAPPWTRMRGLPQNGGYVEAIDVRTGQSLWMLKVFDATAHASKEQDKQDTFIQELKLSADARTLEVVDERNRRYKIALKTRRVTRLK